MVNRQGQTIKEVPAPCVESGSLLVQVQYSCISREAEIWDRSSSSATPLWKKALKNPQRVKQAIKMVMTQGFQKTKNTIEKKRTLSSPTGYSAAGEVVQVGAGVMDLGAGDRVACAGRQFSHHAEVISVPRNLIVPIPDSVSSSHASTVAAGAIAMQGMRRASPALGETFVVMGLDLLGQLTLQFLKQSGCHVIGIDADTKRVELAKSLGMDVGLQDVDVEEIKRLTGGYGADGVLITVTPSSFSDFVSASLHLCRRRGRVVVVGDVSINLNREDFYQKEIDFFISTSYGPGSYDSTYEEQGIDYPLPYVRWTENRNMAAYLDLLERGKLEIDPLITDIYPIEKVQEAYATLTTNLPKPLGVLLSYPRSPTISHTVTTPRIQYKKGHIVDVAVVGAGNFAKSVLLPNLEDLRDLFQVKAIVSRFGHNAASTAEQFQAPISSTSYEEILANPGVDAIIITSHRNLPQEFVLKTLRAGKHLLMEKFLCAHQGELEGIKDYFSQNSSAPLLLTGFNRRFSPAIQSLKPYLKKPLIINYRMNTEYVTQKHCPQQEMWGRGNSCEACHIYDLFTYLTGDKVSQISAQGIRHHSDRYHGNDNFVATMQFQGGSVATLTYTSMGSRDYPKEHMEIYSNGKVIVLEEYKRVSLFGAKGARFNAQTANKGDKEELIAFGSSILSGDSWPIPLWQQFQATEISLEVERQLTTDAPVG